MKSVFCYASLQFMNDDRVDQLPHKNDTTETQPQEKRLRRATRYQRVQERKAKQAKADRRFHGIIFSIIGAVTLIALLSAILAMRGLPSV